MRARAESPIFIGGDLARRSHPETKTPEEHYSASKRDLSEALGAARWPDCGQPPHASAPSAAVASTAPIRSSRPRLRRASLGTLLSRMIRANAAPIRAGSMRRWIARPSLRSARARGHPEAARRLLVSERGRGPKSNRGAAFFGRVRLRDDRQELPGTMNAAPGPCAARMRMSESASGATAQASEATTKTA